MNALLDIESLTAGYGHADVLHDVSLQLEAGEFAAIVGANGAGKSTLLKTVMGLVKGTGSVRLDGEELLGAPAHRRVSKGITYVPEGRRIFPAMTVEENLRVVRSGSRGSRGRIDQVLDLFPALARRRRTMAGSLSGGEQQMLAMGRALVVRPKLLVADEITLGLAPVVVDQLVDSLLALQAEGVAILLAEQNARVALEAATTGYVLEVGRITLQGEAADLRKDERIVAAYLENY